jgi:cytoskeletal protein RodZ
MESLGNKLQQARLAKRISIEEASRITKIRASRLQEIENEDFSSFSSLAYAKGFLLIYGKFLDVDVTPYLDAFETSREVSVDGYSYLQEAPTTAPLPVVRRQPTRRPTLFPLLIAVGVLVLGLYLVKLLLNIQRIAPREGAPTTSVTATATPSPSPLQGLVAPRALPVEGTPANEAMVSPTPTATSAAVAPTPTEPEVRRALPVHPGEVVPTPPNETQASLNEVQIIPIRLTYLRVKVDGAVPPAFDDWLDPAHPPLTFRGRRVILRVVDRGGVEIKKNGTVLPAGDADVTFE